MNNQLSTVLGTYEEAKRLLNVDAASCMVKGRQIVEIIVRDIISRYDRTLLSTPDGKLIDFIRELSDHHLAPDGIIDIMHKIRKAGNEAAHAKNTSPEIAAKQADLMMSQLDELIRWYQNACGSGSLDRTIAEEQRRNAAFTSFMSTLAAAAERAPTPAASHKRKSGRFAKVVTGIFAVTGAIILFLNRRQLMILLFKTDRMMDRGLVFNVAWPMIWLLIPLGVVSAVIYIALDKLAERESGHKHPALRSIVIILAAVVIGAVAWDQTHPGFFRSIQEWAQQTLLPAENSDTEKTSGQTDYTTARRENADVNGKTGQAENTRPPTEEQEPSEISFRVIRDDGLTLRKGAGNSTGSVKKLKKGTIVYALDDTIVEADNRHWRSVRTESGETGWIICEWIEQVETEKQTDSPVPTADTPVPAQQTNTATTVFSGITFTVKKNGSSRGVLTVRSETKEQWMFAPWVGGQSTVTLYRSDGTKSYAFINKSNMYFTYHTQFFDLGHTFTFDLIFDDDSTANWSKVEIDLAAPLRTEEIFLKFE